MSFSFSSFTQAESVAVIEFDQFDQFFTRPEKPNPNKLPVVFYYPGTNTGRPGGFL